MKIIGCDFHPSYQQIAVLDPVTGEMVEKALSHERKEEVRAFYAGLEGSVRVGIEASGQSQWFERMLAELGHEVWIGDAAKIRASCERKQKTDRRDAELLLRLLAEDRFPRIWVPHRRRAGRAAVALASSQAGAHAHAGEEPVAGTGAESGRATEVEAVERGGKKAAGVVAAAALGEPAESGVAAAARSAGGVDRRTGPCGEPSRPTPRPAARRLMTHPGVGPVTALAFTLTMGPAERFGRGKQVASYLGLIPRSIPAAVASSGSGTSANRAIRFCAGCWWKRRRVRCGMSRRCVAPINDWPSGSVVRWRK